MVKKNEHKESFFNWIKTKGMILGVLGGLILAFFLMKWIITIPYQIHNYLNIGYWGVLVGGISLFMVVNLPLGIMFIVFKFDEADIFLVEMPCAISSAIITAFTYLWIAVPPF